MNLWKASTFVLGGVLVLGLVYETARPARAEVQPHMQAALTSLQAAKTQLQTASADKGGHRVKALALTNDAIEEVKKGIAYDNAH